MEIYGLELNDTLQHDKGLVGGMDGVELRNFAHLKELGRDLGWGGRKGEHPSIQEFRVILDFLNYISSFNKPSYQVKSVFNYIQSTIHYFIHSLW